MAGNKDCTSQDDVDLLIYTCDKTQELWYFTEPGHPAHPGVIRRYVIQNAKGVSVAEQGWSFAPDSAQPAFKTFLAQIQALDFQAQETMAAEHGGSAQPETSIRVYGNWQPQGSDNQAVVSLTKHYFSLEDGGQYEQSYALLGASLAAMLPFAEYVSLANRSVASVGHVKSRIVRTIDWEKNSPLGPPGIYAALDYEAEAKKGQLCGFVAWQRQPDGFYVLVREETNIIPDSMSASEAAALKAKFHCVT